ncbi:trans-acting enoyl reductase family protein [Conexibacter sp. SYSU D00693]|uniref:saccharopine dehydrogenase family protein n=1 Tax=Conexibacter sp. SYSU D00693 TaxID=2812560 RepID=UPI00196A51DF|nr:saccharopine dehydrogenase NADP-binding domain-containing protein [Conexibacter sp. SYSU D00693]
MPPAKRQSQPEHEHDVVVFGATGFVGRLTATYLVEHAPEGTRIALGGRSRSKLERVREELGPAAAQLPLVEADSQDDEALARMVASTRAVATTVGPYHAYGMPLLQACAAAGTHYADLTGEVLFMRRAIDTAHDKAMASGARIVHTCGFDSIPSDLGVLLLHEAARDRGLGELGETTFVLRRTRGGFSGGTIASMKGQVDEARRDQAARRLMLDPHGLSPDRSAEPDNGERDPMGVVRDDELGGWLAPFVMGSVNSRVVRRSNALQGHAYGRGLRYRELMLGGAGPVGAARAGAIAAAIPAMFGGLAIPPTRMLLDRLLPDPGEGPSERSRERGFFEIDVHTRTTGGEHLRCRVAAQGDPGYKATAVMLGESALALALDEASLPDAAGVLTPATAMGDVLVDRLRAAGHTYVVATG